MRRPRSPRRFRRQVLHTLVSGIGAGIASVGVEALEHWSQFIARHSSGAHAALVATVVMIVARGAGWFFNRSNNG